jgi:ABC-type Zn uptake system ZnuABC Zn-binding protein ZnuA
MTPRLIFVNRGFRLDVCANPAPRTRWAAPRAPAGTTTQVEDFVGNVGGERITVLPVLAPDDDPHS